MQTREFCGSQRPSTERDNDKAEFASRHDEVTPPQPFRKPAAATIGGVRSSRVRGSEARIRGTRNTAEPQSRYGRPRARRRVQFRDLCVDVAEYMSPVLQRFVLGKRGGGRSLWTNEGLRPRWLRAVVHRGSWKRERGRPWPRARSFSKYTHARYGTVERAKYRV